MTTQENVRLKGCQFVMNWPDHPDHFGDHFGDHFSGLSFDHDFPQSTNKNIKQMISLVLQFKVDRVIFCDKIVMGPRTRIFRWEFNLLHLRGREKKEMGLRGSFYAFHRWAEVEISRRPKVRSLAEM